MRRREPLTITARMCSSQDCIGKDKADGVSIERETSSTIMDEAEVDCLVREGEAHKPHVGACSLQVVG
jgi:hypothetical protein